MKKKLITTALFILMAWSSLVYGQNSNTYISLPEVDMNDLFSATPAAFVFQMNEKPKIYTFRLNNTLNPKLKRYFIIKPKNYLNNSNLKHRVLVFLPGQGAPHFKIEHVTRLISQCYNNGVIFVGVAQTHTASTTSNGTTTEQEVDAEFSNNNFIELRRFGTLDTSVGSPHNPILADMKMLDVISSKIAVDLKSNTNVSKVDNDRIYICGHSSGAITTQLAAMYLNDKFAAFGSVAGIAHQSISGYNPKHKVPIIMFNALNDNNVKYKHGNKSTDSPNLRQLYYGHHSARQWYNINGGMDKLDRIYNEPGNNATHIIIDPFNNDNMFVRKYYINNNPFFEFYHIYGGGHHWHQTGGYSTETDPFAVNYKHELPLKELCQDIHTTQLLISFFDKHTKSGNNANGVNLNATRNNVIQNLSFRYNKTTTRPVVINRLAQNLDEIEIGTELSKNYKIYPTLVEDIVNVELENDSNASYSITLVNMLGQVIENQMLNGIKDEVTKTTFNTVSLSPNLYFIQVEKNGEKIISEKIIKK